MIIESTDVTRVASPIQKRTRTPMQAQWTVICQLSGTYHQNDGTIWPSWTTAKISGLFHPFDPRNAGRFRPQTKCVYSSIPPARTRMNPRTVGSDGVYQKRYHALVTTLTGWISHCMSRLRRPPSAKMALKMVCGRLCGIEATDCPGTVSGE